MNTTVGEEINNRYRKNKCLKLAYKVLDIKRNEMFEESEAEYEFRLKLLNMPLTNFNLIYGEV